MKTITLTLENDDDEQLLLKIIDRFNIKVENSIKRPDTEKMLKALNDIRNLENSGFDGLDPIKWQGDVRQDRELPLR